MHLFYRCDHLLNRFIQHFYLYKTRVNLSSLKYTILSKCDKSKEWHWGQIICRKMSGMKIGLWIETPKQFFNQVKPNQLLVTLSWAVRTGSTCSLQKRIMLRRKVCMPLSLNNWQGAWFILIRHALLALFWCRSTPKSQEHWNSRNFVLILCGLTIS